MSVYTILPDKTLDLSQPVRVFRNLSTKFKREVVYSIWQHGKLVAHGSSVHLTQVCFVVQHPTRLRSMQLKRKLVHAFVTGHLEPTMPHTADFQAASYLPAKGYFFTRAEPEKELATTGAAVLDVAGLRVRPATYNLFEH